MLTVGTDFSGIGAAEQALKNLKIPHKVLFACDKDKYAKETYLANHSTEIFFDDITTRNQAETPYVDLYCFGNPCQSFSISGKRLGFEDIRGTLFFNSAEYIKINRPKYFIMENVKGLLSHDKPKGSKSKHGRTFSTMINLLAKTVNGQNIMPFYDDNLGYNVYYAVLNSKFYDVPQNRERIFVVGFRDDVSFSFPNSKVVTKRLKDILEPVVDKKYFLSEKMLSFLQEHSDKKQSEGCGFKFTPKTGDDIGTTVTARVYKMGIDDNYIVVPEATKQGYATAREGDSINVSNINSKTRRGRVGVGVENTLDTGCQQVVVVPDDSEVFCAASRGRGEGNVQQLEFRDDEVSNTITSVQKDNLVVIKDKPIQLSDSKESGGQQPYQQNRIYDSEGVSPAVLAGMSSVSHAVKIGIRIRRLTPLETMRLQAFDDSFIKPCSETQQYKMAGNSITVTVLMAIIKNIFKTECNGL